MAEETEKGEATEDVQESAPATPASKPKAKKKQAGKKQARKKQAKRKNQEASSDTRKRAARPYPKFTLQETLVLGEAIYEFASGEKVRRLTLLGRMNKSPTSSATQNLITNSSKYGVTKGSYLAEWLELTPLGATACNLGALPRERLEARFKLAVENIAPFQRLYSEYKGKRLPIREVLKDVLSEANFEIDDLSECVDIFVVNAKFLGVLQTIAGSEMLIPIEQALDEIPAAEAQPKAGAENDSPHQSEPNQSTSSTPPSFTKVNWAKTCFVITPIGEEGSNERRHADLFLGSLIEPALSEFGLEIIRADKIGAAGMITSQILEYVMRARLAIVDLSYHNPNAFYEMAIRHACKMPVIQISRKSDRLCLLMLTKYAPW